MDVTFNNILEGTRQYFLGLPKPTGDGTGQAVWPTGSAPPEEGAPAQSGAPAPTSRPPSAAATPPSAPSTPVAPPPRPPSEPLEPEPHIIHKATVMREALEKRREQPEHDDDDETTEALSPLSHIIRKPATSCTMPSPAPAPAAPCPSPARPPSAVAPPDQKEAEYQSTYRPPSHRVQTPTSRPPDHYTAGRPPDPYTASRPPESYARYHYETSLTEGGRNLQGPSVASSQPSSLPRHSPQQNFGRLTNSVSMHTAARMRETALHNSPSQQRYTMPTSQPPPHNDRVPPLHHPTALPPTQRVTPVDSNRTVQAYSMTHHRHDTSPYGRAPTHYERHTSVAPRKYDPQQAYPGYRPTPTVPPPAQNHRIEAQHHPYKAVAVEGHGAHYAARTPDRVAPVPQETRLSRVDYNINRNMDARNSYHYPNPSTSTSRYPSNSSVATCQNSTIPPRSATYRPSPVPAPSLAPAPSPKAPYPDYPSANHVHTSPARSTAKPTFANQPARMTVTVTSLVNQMNQTKQKRESPLDLSVKTVKNSADSSTTQDDMVDSVSAESKSVSLQQRPASNSRHVSTATQSLATSHKVDFAPDFHSQYTERPTHHQYNHIAASAQPPVRYNGAYEPSRPAADLYSLESRQATYTDRSKYNVSVPKNDYVPRIDLTRAVAEERVLENRLRDDRHFVIEERKRTSGPIVNNIPEKIVRYETWTADSRIDHINRSAREQQELMSRPVYSYSSHKRFEAYQKEQINRPAPSPYGDTSSHISHKYSYPKEPSTRVPTNYHSNYLDRNSSSSSRQVVPKIHNHREHHHHHHLDHHSGVPADKRVLSILRNSLEIKQTGTVEPARHVRQIPDLIVIDDADDDIEITDLTKENDKVSKVSLNQIMSPTRGHAIQMPKAIDSMVRDGEHNRREIIKPKSRSPENDVASRIRTKAELKVMPPQETIIEPIVKSETDDIKLQPKSQKQHLFNRIRQDNLRFESVIKNDQQSAITIPEVKTEPMSIEDIEKDAEVNIKIEDCVVPESSETAETSLENDLDWASACDSFLEQLKDGCHKKKTRKKRVDTDNENKFDIHSNPISSELVEQRVSLLAERSAESNLSISKTSDTNLSTLIAVKQEPLDEDETLRDSISINKPEIFAEEKKNNDETKDVLENTKNSPDEKSIHEKNENIYKNDSVEEKTQCKVEKKGSFGVKKDRKDQKKEKRNIHKIEKKVEISTKHKIYKSKLDKKSIEPTIEVKKESDPIKTLIKEELESTDDDEPLIKSKLLKQKEESERMNYQLLKDLSEKSAYVKLECFDVELNKNNRRSLDSMSKDKDIQVKQKTSRQSLKSKAKSLSTETKIEKQKELDSSSESDEDITVASRLRIRKNIKNEDSKNTSISKTPVKMTPKKHESSSSTPVRKPGFGDGSDFHPGWEEELYKYKRSLRMPTRLIAIPRGRSGGPFVRGSGGLFTRGSTSLPDLDPAPLSPAPSSALSAATDDLYARRQDKATLDSDLDSNSSFSTPLKLHYDSEASSSTVFSAAQIKKKTNSIVDVLIQKCGKKEDNKRKSKDKNKEENTPKVIAKNPSELLPTPSLGLIKNSGNGTLSAKKDKIMEEIFYLGAFRKETVSAFRSEFIKNTDGIIGATEEFSPVVLKSRTRTESRVLKQRATIKEVFGDERPASAPPTSYRDEDKEDILELALEIKKEPENSKSKPLIKSKKIIKDKIKKRSSSIRDGLRSTKSLKRNDAKGRLLRLKKRNNLLKSLPSKRIKELVGIKQKKEKSPTPVDDNNKEKSNEEGVSTHLQPEESKRRFKRLFGRRKLSSGFDYIRKKKKIIRREDGGVVKKIRRIAPKPTPESVHDIAKEIKGWFINKSIGETSLHRAARLGYTDCVAYCLEKMEADPSAKDNAGFTPLHVAAARGHVRIARYLLQYGANVSAAAQGGIRPLHEASENNHVEMIRLLLSYGADPILGTYAGQTPVELAEGVAFKLLRLHIADVQGYSIEPWIFTTPADIIDPEELGCDPLASPPPASPPPPPDSTMEIQCTEAPLPPFYSLRSSAGQPSEGLWCLLQDITSLLQIKSKESLLKQIHCGSGSPKELLREIRTQEFLERAQCHQLLCAGEKVNVRASKVALVRVTDKLRQLLKVETVLVS